MNQPISERVRWTTADLELFPDNGNRYEIIDGELFVTRAPQWNHQKTCVIIIAPLDTWSQATSLGEVVPALGIIFGDNDNVIPDVVWASNERLPLLLDEAGHLTGAPELVISLPSLVEERNPKFMTDIQLTNEQVQLNCAAKTQPWAITGQSQYPHR
ncbi:MAG: Uma2 family endonuclease [Nostoc sp.]|uniref:Uma2 family endonuclease n=1 Tax=Nostoc sp. TaxID=1180 RepID=UPI002FF0A334